MTPDWCKLRADFPRHRKVYKAGRDGALLFTGLICLNRERGEAGTIPAEWCSPADLAFAFPAFRMSEDEIAGALDGLSQAGLLELGDDGAVTLVGYDEDFMPRCSGCGSANTEPRYRTCPKCRSRKRTAQNTDGLQKSTSETHPPLQKTTALEQSRAEQSRQEQIGIGAEQRGGDGLDPATALRAICSVLASAGWGNSDTHRAAKAQTLATRWAPEQIQACWDKARKAADRPGRYFAKLIKSDDYIWDVVKGNGKS